MSHELSPRLQSELADSPIFQHQDQYYTRIYHAVNPGDLIAAMGAIKKYYDVTKRKVIVSQSVTQLAQYYQGATHPTTNERGENVCMNMQMWQMIKPLIESQEYIHEFEVYQGQKIDLDFNRIRGQVFVNMPQGAIQNWLSFCFPDLAFDLSEAWVILKDECPEHIKSQVQGKVILNFTERYRNHMLDYFFLQNYSPDLIFSGTEKEHYIFCSKWGLNVPRLEVKDFLELAYAIKEARFLYANQSFNYNLSEALKTKRAFEVCSFAQNCIQGLGKDSYGYINQVGAEYYFRRLYNETK